MSRRLTIIHLYPREMNIYGDRGNVITLVKRLEWRGLEAEVREVGIGDHYDFTEADLVFAGGGQDRGQVRVGEDLLKREANLQGAAEAGVVMLTVCGTYQLFGRGFITMEGQDIPGVNIFHAQTVGSNHRMIGNITVDSPWGRLVGFENHSGETMLEPDQDSIGKVSRGFGNDYHSGYEGAVIYNVYGTYLHGPLLPKNPRLADHLLKLAWERKHGDWPGGAIDDALANQAARVAANCPQ